MHLKPNKTLEDLSHLFNPILIGWVNYYCLFYKSEMYRVLKHMNRALTLWAQRKYKRFAGHKSRASGWLGIIARREPNLFVHWQMGIFPGAG
jgi:RNA-directed DNA polymerase